MSGTITLGKRAIYSTSTKQKLNIKSLTKSKVVGVDNVLLQVIWSKYFLEAQEYKVTSNLIY